MLRRLLILGLFVVLGCAKPMPSRAPLAIQPLKMSAGEWRVVDHVVVVTDASGTMHSARTFPEAKALTQSFVSAMPDPNAPARSPGSYEAGLIGFGGKARATAALAPFDRSKLAATADRLAILGGGYGVGGDTPLDAVLGEVGQQLAKRRGRAALVIFSDGRATSPEDTRSAAQQLVDGYGDGLCIHTVHVGSDPKGEAFLTNLASLSPCGSSRQSSSLGDAGAFQRFTRQVFAGAAPPAPAPVAREAGPCEGVVRLRGINFAFDRADIQPESGPVLDVAVDLLRTCRDFTIEVTGHTDSVGTEAYNQGLSERRAEAVRRYFVRAGIPGERVRASGRGERDPIASNASSEGRAQNRRVELRPVPRS